MRGDTDEDDVAAAIVVVAGKVEDLLDVRLGRAIILDDLGLKLLTIM